MRIGILVLVAGLLVCSPQWLQFEQLFAPADSAVAPVRTRPAQLSDVWPVLAQPGQGDLDAMLQRGEIRVLTSFTLGWYYIEQGQPSGLIFELTRLFEQHLEEYLGPEAEGLKVTVIPVRTDQLVPYLLQGLGDVIFANLTITPDLSEQVRFSIPVIEPVRELVVSGPDSQPLSSLDHWDDRPITVRRDSSYHDSLQQQNQLRFQRGLPELTVQFADPRLEDEDLLEMVALGQLAATVIGDHKLPPWQRALPELVVQGQLVVRDGGQVAWAMRPDSPKMQALVDSYVQTHPMGSKLYNIVTGRYLRGDAWLQEARQQQPFAGAQELIPLFEKYGQIYDFDWVLLMAFAYQESRFNPGAKSPVGAVGVMQVMPSTAKDRRIDIADIHLTENNIHAGTKYLDLLRRSYFDDGELSEFNRMIFAMAAYNAGPNRINRLRREAEARGLDPNVWFNNVEDLVAAQIGGETVNYVANVYRYFVSYKRVLAEQEARSTIRQRWQDAHSVQDRS
ncbi:MltF family protein [Ferrimonas marina]|uniref:Membrane-bound lytic murein transglycosylase MltF n=1 Tax=Ferrimonas marina TaxID=299255 RepID=A0A1M5R6T7_9GAMM|nr:transglycosylase SLT domain-containing protein [Ferrimonas marina]SHH22032.1 Membrane-bound lytic murein transglycosylase MltF [Ferrimonas marina]